MPRKRLPPDDPREWLNRARSNLACARNTLPGVYLEDLCFNAQQAAEKAIKAVLIHRDAAFPYVHDLDRLLKVLEQSGLKIPKYVWDADELSPFAVEARYPGLSGPVSPREHRRAVRVAEAVLRWATRQVEKALPVRGRRTTVARRTR
jgi:HEPN domain-containing protein